MAPVSVSVNPGSPAVAELGLMVVKVGAGFGGGGTELIVKV